MDLANQPGLETVEANLGYAFKERKLLEEALVHRSYPNENPDTAVKDNERLEFLGDAFIGLVIANHLYARFPGLNEGNLTDHRSALVRRETLARLAISLDLGTHLLMGSGEEASGGRDRSSILAGVLEAVLGAVFQDRGYAVARGLALRLFKGELRRLMQEGVPKDPKNLLQETIQAQGMGPPTYRTVSEEGPEHARLFEIEVLVEEVVLGRGQGMRKVDAQRDAAREALLKLAEARD